LFNEKPLIVPIFIPNQGCPHRCVFCDQEKITSQPARPLKGQTVREVLDQARRSGSFLGRRHREIAFYGGTFASLPEKTIRELLGVAAPYLQEGIFHSVRVSTRPDSLDGNKVALLKALGVSTVELGSQSMDDEVLRMTRRGHTAGDTEKAAELLRQHGFKVGIQLMPGLPGDSAERFCATVQEVIRIKPDMVRLYPVVVIRGTELAQWFENGTYRPITLEEAVRICAESCLRFEEAGIPVIRIGLMTSPSLREKGQVVGGPWHESFGHLVRAEIYQGRIEPFLPGPGEATRISIRIPSQDISLLRGHRNEGLRRIEERTKAMIDEILSDDSLPSGRIAVETR
jgi:histone acetyltransferase (RNA polymerase elongator complex component)